MSEHPTEQPVQWFRLEPTDAWFFRDGRPSNRDEDQSDLESHFPPHPSTLVGALRAALAREQGWDGHGRWDQELNETLGNGFDDLGRLDFTGPLLEKEGQLLFPMPAHVLGKNDSDDGAGQDINAFQPLDWLVPSDEPIVCDMGAVHLPRPLGRHKTAKGEKAPRSADDFFVTATGMEKILRGELPARTDCIHHDDLFRFENRVGIERGAETRTTGAGAMYSPRYVRLNAGVRLVVGVSGLPDGWELPRYFPIGGESRLAACDKIEPPDFPEQHPGGENIVLVLGGPACFTQGDWWGAGPGDAAEKLAPSMGGVTIGGSVSSATFDRPIGIGGWDSRNRQPLAMQPYLRPGAVWWLDAGANVCVEDGKYLQIGGRTAYGYGLAFIGTQPSK